MKGLCACNHNRRRFWKHTHTLSRAHTQSQFVLHFKLPHCNFERGCRRCLLGKVLLFKCIFNSALIVKSNLTPHPHSLLCQVLFSSLLILNLGSSSCEYCDRCDILVLFISSYVLCVCFSAHMWQEDKHNILQEFPTRNFPVCSAHNIFDSVVIYSFGNRMNGGGCHI